MIARERWLAFRQRVIGTRSGRLTLRVLIGLVGGVVVLSGLVLVPLPGPGWLIVLAGLAVWSIEFAWARRLLAFARRQLESWWHWLERQHWSVRVLVGLLTLVVVVGVTWTSAAFSLGTWRLWERLN